MPFLTQSNQTIYYTDAGQGAAIVLVHGYPLDGRVWNDVISILVKSYRVITVDLRGFGQSSETGEFSTKDLARDLVALVDHLKTGPCVLAGLSMGGYVLQQLVRIAPDRVSKLILVDTRANADDAEGRKKRDAMASMVLDKGSKAVADAMMPNMLAPGHAREVETRLRTIMESQRPQTLAAACRAMRDREDFLGVIGSVAAPIHMIVGSDDAISPLAVAQEIVGKAKQGRLHIIAGAGHMSPIEKPAEVAAALIDAMES